MGGRELSVTKVFEAKLCASARKNNLDDLTIATCGMDRDTNADNIFAAGNKLILVEFKSNFQSLNSEADKESACQLCTALVSDESLQKLHDQCHFISWGDTDRLGNLNTKVCVYRKRICNKKTLPECTTIDEQLPSEDGYDDDLFISELMKQRAGLNCDLFIKYLKQLLKRKSGRIADDKFRVALYGVSASREVYGCLFKTYDDLEEWFNPPIKKPKMIR